MHCRFPSTIFLFGICGELLLPWNIDDSLLHILSFGSDFKHPFKLRFSLNALIADTTSETGICLSDEVSQKLCGFSCSEIIAQVGSENRKTIPNVFDETMNKTKIFYLQLMRNSKPKRHTYVVIDIQSDTPTPIPPTPATPSSTPPPVSTPPSTVRTETSFHSEKKRKLVNVSNMKIQTS
ncbi:hypothetical protein LXL04_031477 [Taraxacum kok-saghyz]